MPSRTDRPLDIAPLHSIPPPPPPSPFALFHAFSRSFFLSRFPFLSSPFPSNVFSSHSSLRKYVWSRDNFGWQKTKRGRMAVTRETRSMRHFAVKVARFSMEMLVLTYSRGEGRGISYYRFIDHFEGKFLADFALILGWQLSNCGCFLENQRQFFHGTK